MQLKNDEKVKYSNKNINIEKTLDGLYNVLNEIFLDANIDVHSQEVSYCKWFDCEDIIQYSGVFWIYKGAFQVEFILYEDLYFKVISALGHEVEMEDVFTSEQITSFKNKLEYEIIFLQFKMLDGYLKMLFPKKYFRYCRWGK